MRMLARRLAALAAAVVLSLSVAACSGGSSTTASSAAADVRYKCACGVEKPPAAGGAVPQCCGRPMIKK